MLNVQSNHLGLGYIRWVLRIWHKVGLKCLWGKITIFWACYNVDTLMAIMSILLWWFWAYFSGDTIMAILSILWWCYGATSIRVSLKRQSILWWWFWACFIGSLWAHGPGLGGWSLTFRKLLSAFEWLSLHLFSYESIYIYESHIWTLAFKWLSLHLLSYVNPWH